MVSGLVLEFFIDVGVELAVDADAITMLDDALPLSNADALPLTDAGLSSSIRESIDREVRDDEVILVSLLDDSLLLTNTIALPPTNADAGLGSSMGKSFDEVVPDDEVNLAT